MPVTVCVVLIIQLKHKPEQSIYIQDYFLSAVRLSVDKRGVTAPTPVNKFALENSPWSQKG